MKTKRIFAIAAVVIVFMIPACFIYFTSTRTDPGRVDGEKILMASQAYVHDLQARKVAIPATVSIQELITKRFLSPSEVSGFDGMKVTISLTPKDDSHPQEVLVSARLKDGSQIVSTVDAGIRVLPK
jgi:hypothetical protein